jgi:sulfur relay (sulfurtransferase) DsrC/TusE family protein
MENTYLYVILLPQMNEKRELGYMIKFGFSENFENRMRIGYSQYHNYVEVLHLYEGKFTKDDETRIKQYFRERDCVFIREEYLKFIPEVLDFFDTYNTAEKLKSKISQLPKISKSGRSYVVNNLYIECILNKCYPDLQLVDRQNMRGKLYKELRSYIPKEQIVYIQSAYNISEENLLKYVEDHTIDLSNISDEIKKLADEFCSLKNTSSRLKYLVKVSEKLGEEDMNNFLSLIIPERFKDYYVNMGPDRIKANSYQESRLKAEWNKQHQEELGVSDELVQDIMNYFKLGQRYTNPDIKAKLKELYQKHGYEKSAKAIDLKEYFYLKRVYIASKRKNGFEIQKKR